MDDSRPDIKELIARLNVLLERLGEKSPEALVGDRIGLQVLQALGIQTQGVTSFTISFAADEIVIATVRSVVDKARMEQVCNKYLARLKAEPQITQTVGDVASPERIALSPATPETPAEDPTAVASRAEASSTPTLQELVRAEVAAQLKAHRESLVAGILRSQQYGPGSAL